MCAMRNRTQRRVPRMSREAPRVGGATPLLPQRPPLLSGAIGLRVPARTHAVAPDRSWTETFVYPRPPQRLFPSIRRTATCANIALASLTPDLDSLCWRACSWNRLATEGRTACHQLNREIRPERVNKERADLTCRVGSPTRRSHRTRAWFVWLSVTDMAHPAGSTHSSPGCIMHHWPRLTHSAPRNERLEIAIEASICDCQACGSRRWNGMSRLDMPRYA